MLPGQELCRAKAAFPITATRGTNVSVLLSYSLMLLFPPAHLQGLLSPVPYLDRLSEPDIFLQVEPLPPHTPHLSSFLEDPTT